MTLQQLRYIVAIAEAGTLSGAAKALFISQPSLTKTVQELENEWASRSLNGPTKGSFSPMMEKSFRLCPSGPGTSRTP